MRPSSTAGGTRSAEIASPPKSFTLYCSGRKISHSSRLIGISMPGSEISEPPFLAKGDPECIKTNEIEYKSIGRKPGRSRGTRLPSGASTGLTFSPETSAERMDAPCGNAIFRNGCAWFLMFSFTSVRDLPSEVTSVVTTALCTTAARTLLSGNRTHSKARIGASFGCR